MSEADTRKHFKKQDWIVIGILLAGILVLFLLQTPWKKTSGGTVVITVDGAEIGSYPLGADTVIAIENADGIATNTLTIKDGAAKMTEADCPDQYCVHQKKIRFEGETIVCLPNRVLVTVTGGDAPETDAMVR